MDGRNRQWTLIAVSAATFMTYLDNNIVNVAMPRIQHDLHLTVSGLEWVVSSYILVFASLLLAGGRLGDLFGHRRMFLGGLGVFTLASFVAGISGSVDVLVASRGVQGLGAALVTPTTLAIISATFPDPRERTRSARSAAKPWMTRRFARSICESGWTARSAARRRSGTSACGARPERWPWPSAPCSAG